MESRAKDSSTGAVSSVSPETAPALPRLIVAGLLVLGSSCSLATNLEDLGGPDARSGDASVGPDSSDAAVTPDVPTVDVMVNPEAACVDLDKDGFYDKFTACDSGNATDCNDHDPRVNPGVVGFVLDIPDSGNLSLPFPNADWNCDGKVDFQFGTFTSAQCTSMSVGCSGIGFQMLTGCGQLGWFGTCSGAAICNYVDGGLQRQGCR